MSRYRIIDSESGDDVTDLVKEEYLQARHSKTDYETFKSDGHPQDKIPTDKETQLDLIKKVIDKYLGYLTYLD